MKDFFLNPSILSPQIIPPFLHKSVGDGSPTIISPDYILEHKNAFVNIKNDYFLRISTIFMALRIFRRKKSCKKTPRARGVFYLLVSLCV